MTKVRLLTEEQATQITGYQIANFTVNPVIDANGNKFISNDTVNAILSCTMDAQHSHLSWVGTLPEIDHEPYIPPGY